jgi:hypothetical protein
MGCGWERATDDMAKVVAVIVLGKRAVHSMKLRLGLEGQKGDGCGRYVFQAVQKDEADARIHQPAPLAYIRVPPMALTGESGVESEWKTLGISRMAKDGHP